MIAQMEDQMDAQNSGLCSVPKVEFESLENSNCMHLEIRFWLIQKIMVKSNNSDVSFSIVEKLGTYKFYGLQMIRK